MYFGVSTDPAIERLRDEFPFVGCGLCTYFSVRADFPGEACPCKRLDHKSIRFYTPWFMSYDCGQRGAVMCRDFVPSSTVHRLAEQWPGADAYTGEIPEDARLSLRLKGEKQLVYQVKFKEFYNGSFLTDGKLRVYGKWYYRVSRKSPTGYELVKERYDVPIEIEINKED